MKKQQVSAASEVTYKNGLITLRGKLKERILADAERRGLTPEEFANRIIAVSMEEKIAALHGLSVGQWKIQQEQKLLAPIKNDVVIQNNERDAMGFRNGKLVKSIRGKVRSLSLRESVIYYLRNSKDEGFDSYHTAARRRWFKQVAAALPA